MLGDDRYRLERPLGAGGMAVVWLASDERLQRPVAVKVLSDVLAVDAAYIRRFEREARIAAQLSHPNLVRLFDYSAEAARPFLVMEYVEGTTLASVLEGEDQRRGLDVDRIARELLGALAYIHAAGIVHRDVKPANVMIDRAGSVKLTDFGIAQAADASRLTQTGNVIGTLKYLPPEVIDGQPATARSDLYACGVLLRDALRASPSPAVAAVSEMLANPDPDGRPETAEDALALLERPDGAQTAVLGATEAEWSHRSAPTAALRTAAEPRVAAGRRARAIGPRALIALGVALVAIMLAIAVSSGGEGPGEALDERSRPSVSPSAPLDDQLRSLEQDVDDAAR